MNVPELPGRFDYVLRLCDIFVSLSESSILLCSHFCIPESFLVVGFSPHGDTTGVFRIAHGHT